MSEDEDRIEELEGQLEDLISDLREGRPDSLYKLREIYQAESDYYPRTRYAQRYYKLRELEKGERRYYPRTRDIQRYFFGAVTETPYPETPWWFMEQPAFLKVIAKKTGAVPEDWYVFPSYMPEPVKYGTFAGSLGWLSPVGLLPFYTMWGAIRLGRAGVIPGFGDYTYQKRYEQVANLRAYHLTRAVTYPPEMGGEEFKGYTPWTAEERGRTLEDLLNYRFSKGYLAQARMDYWQQQQQLAIPRTAYDIVKGLSYIRPLGMAPLRAFGFPFIGMSQRLASGRAMLPSLLKALEYDRETALETILTSPSYWPFHRPSLLQTFTSDIGMWTAGQVGFWGGKAALQGMIVPGGRALIENVFADALEVGMARAGIRGVPYSTMQQLTTTFGDEAMATSNFVTRGQVAWARGMQRNMTPRFGATRWRYLGRDPTRYARGGLMGTGERAMAVTTTRRFAISPQTIPEELRGQGTRIKGWAAFKTVAKQTIPWSLIQPALQITTEELATYALRRQLGLPYVIDEGERREATAKWATAAGLYYGAYALTRFGWGGGMGGAFGVAGVAYTGLESTMMLMDIGTGAWKRRQEPEGYMTAYASRGPMGYEIPFKTPPEQRDVSLEGLKLTAKTLIPSPFLPSFILDKFPSSIRIGGWYGEPYLGGEEGVPEVYRGKLVETDYNVKIAGGIRSVRSRWLQYLEDPIPLSTEEKQRRQLQGEAYDFAPASFVQAISPGFSPTSYEWTKYITSARAQALAPGLPFTEKFEYYLKKARWERGQEEADRRVWEPIREYRKESRGLWNAFWRIKYDPLVTFGPEFTGKISRRTKKPIRDYGTSFARWMYYGYGMGTMYQYIQGRLDEIRPDVMRGAGKGMGWRLPMSPLFSDLIGKPMAPIYSYPAMGDPSLRTEKPQITEENKLNLYLSSLMTLADPARYVRTHRAMFSEKSFRRHMAGFAPDVVRSLYAKWSKGRQPFLVTAPDYILAQTRAAGGVMYTPGETYNFPVTFEFMREAFYGGWETVKKYPAATALLGLQQAVDPTMTGPELFPRGRVMAGAAETMLGWGVFSASVTGIPLKLFLSRPTGWKAPLGQLKAQRTVNLAQFLGDEGRLDAIRRDPDLLRFLPPELRDLAFLDAPWVKKTIESYEGKFLEYSTFEAEKRSRELTMNDFYPAPGSIRDIQYTQRAEGREIGIGDPRGLPQTYSGGFYGRDSGSRAGDSYAWHGGYPAPGGKAKGGVVGSEGPDTVIVGEVGEEIIIPVERLREATGPEGFNEEQMENYARESLKYISSQMLMNQRVEGA